MQNIEGGGKPARPGERDAMYRVVAELASVIDHIRKSRELIESAVASDATGDDAAADNVIVDDVTPGCERVGAALRECDDGLSAALRLLQGPMRSAEPAGECNLPQAHRTISA
jgi:hypothetical protein